MISFVCWRWRPPAGYRSTFGPETVNTLRKMVARHYAGPHRFICVTDDPRGIDPAVEVVPLWEDFGSLPSPHGRGNPSCYRRLKMFSAEAEQLFGPRFCSLDLDCVITGPLDPIVDRSEDIVLWGDTNPTTPYNGSMILLRAGSRTKVWDDFDPVTSPKKATALGYFGSDQAWLGAALGPNEPKWSKVDGVYSYRCDLRGKGLPSDARIVMFHGQWDPWSREIQQRHAWVREHYR
jgi:hypothetical protein